MKYIVYIVLAFIMALDLYSADVDTLWRHTMPPKPITYLECSRDWKYFYHFTDFHYLFTKNGDKYEHEKLPHMMKFYRITNDDCVIGYKAKDTISVYNCITKTVSFYDVKFLKDYTFWDIAFITSKYYAITDPYNFKFRLYELGTNKLIYELREGNGYNFKQAFLAPDESYFMGLMEGKVLCRFSLKNEKVVYKTQLPDWQDPEYRVLFVNDTTCVVYCDFFKDFMTFNSNTGQIIFQKEMDYYYSMSDYFYIRGDNQIMGLAYYPDNDFPNINFKTVNWITGEMKDFPLRNMISYVVNKNDSLFLDDDSVNTERCILTIYNTADKSLDTIYNEIKLDTLFRQGLPGKIFSKNKVMMNVGYNDSTYIYQLNSAKKIRSFEGSTYQNDQYDDESYCITTSFSPKLKCEKINALTNEVMNVIEIDTNYSVPSFYQNKQYMDIFNYPIFGTYGTSIYDYKNNKIIYTTSDYMSMTYNGAFTLYDSKDTLDDYVKYIVTYIPEIDTSAKYNIEYMIKKTAYKYPYNIAPIIDVSANRDKLVYYDLNNSVVKVDLKTNKADSFQIDIKPMVFFLSHDGKYLQLRDSNRIQVYNYDTKEKIIDYKKSELYKFYGDVYIDHVIISNDSLRDIYCIRFNIGTTDVDEGYSKSYLNTNNYKVYPNPANDYLNIESMDSKLFNSIEIYDIIGESVYKTNGICSNNYKLNIKELSDGMYYLKINDDIIKFIKRKQ